MKEKIYLLMLLICCFSMTPTAMNMESCDTKEELDLSGNLETGKQRSLIKPVQAFISDQSIEVDFNAGLGIIEVSVYDETENMVYQQSVMTFAGQVVTIDISSFDQGKYTIQLMNAQKQYLLGYFSL